MRYYITTSNGDIKNTFGQLLLFCSYSDARHWAINHLDLSVKGISIIDLFNKAFNEQEKLEEYGIEYEFLQLMTLEEAIHYLKTGELSK